VYEQYKSTVIEQCLFYNNNNNNNNNLLYYNDFNLSLLLSPPPVTGHIGAPEPVNPKPNWGPLSEAALESRFYIGNPYVSQKEQKWCLQLQLIMVCHWKTPANQPANCMPTFNLFHHHASVSFNGAEKLCCFWKTSSNHSSCSKPTRKSVKFSESSFASSRLASSSDPPF